MLKSSDRLAILLHGGIRSGDGKTGLALLRYRQGPIVAVIDQAAAGESLADWIDFDRPPIPGEPAEIPIVASIQAALAHQPDVLAIGVAPSGGLLPPAWQAEVAEAVAAGLSIVNGLHSQMARDPLLSQLLAANRRTDHRSTKQWIWDIRQEPAGLQIGRGAARELACRRILTVGSDMAVGAAQLRILQASRRNAYALTADTLVPERDGQTLLLSRAQESDVPRSVSVSLSPLILHTTQNPLSFIHGPIFEPQPMASAR
ncbi:MAG: hypothetical protein HC824_08605 [Synechococcales cyanobacterium RM1_1_8]|nr:hypothetical protein [Synechococcales cyanobacterium RM1_1_8]